MICAWMADHQHSEDFTYEQQSSADDGSETR